jgi:hypothetical protein
MSRVSPIQTNFTAGELSPRLEGRVDLAKYANGCRALENMLVHPHGGASRRSGTRFVAEVKDSAAAVRLVPFEFSTVQAYMLEFGDGYIRFYRDEGRIESPPGSPYEIAAPYEQAELMELQFAQSADIMYIVHPNHAPRKLSRSGHTAWTLAAVQFNDGPYLEANSGVTSITPSATSGSITLTASAALFVAADIGRMVRIKHGSNWGWARITGYSGPTSVSADVGGGFAAASASTTWQFGAWWQAGSYPACVSFYEERLFFAGSRDKPQTIWASRSGDFENFAPTETDGTLADDCALSFTIASDQVNAIRWLSPGAVLAVGTVGGEFTLRASAQDEPLTPANVQVKRQTTRGCAYQPPVQVDSVVLFLQRAGRKIREFVFAFETDGYQAPDLTLLAEHLTRGGLRQLAYMREPDSTLWAARGDGVLLGMTYERPQEVVAWHRHLLGGQHGAGGARVESVAVIPSPDGGEDQLWLAVLRTIDGTTRRYVEFLEAPFDEAQAQSDAFFVDCGLTYAGAAVETIAGLDHLEGETVAVLADGAVHPNRLVTGGEIALDWPAAKVHVGLPYRSRLQTMRFEAGAADGTAQGKTARIHAATVRLWNSLGAKLGADETVESIPFRSSSDAMGSPPALFTGDKRVAFPKGYDTAPRVTVVQDQPLPLTVLAIMPRLTVFDA